ncbi:hypothetical protein AAE478_002044 [Parahypoxylon ruwenzoriense]
MSEAQREAKAEAAGNCGWRVDSPEPELDDLAEDHVHRNRISGEVCSWQGDSPEPELDDLAHDRRESPQMSPRSRETSHIEPKLLEIKPELLDVLKKDKEAEKTENDKKILKESSNRTAPEAPPADKQPRGEDKPEEAPDQGSDETLQSKVIHHGVQHALNILHDIVKHSDSQPTETEPSGDKKPSGEDSTVPPQPPEAALAPPTADNLELKPAKRESTKEGKEEAKDDPREARKAEKERKAKEKEEKKRLKKEKAEAKKQKEKERKEQRRLEKEKKKNKGKKTAAASPPPDLPIGADGFAAMAAVELHPHAGCQICQHPDEQGVVDFVKESWDSWGGLPSLQELTVAAKKLLGMKKAEEPEDTQGATQTPPLNEQELIEHMAEHINRHLHQHLDPNSSTGGNPTADRVTTEKFGPHPARHGGSPGPGKQHESHESGAPTSHGLDGNRDWPMTIMRNPTLRDLAPASAPDITPTQAPPRAYSPLPCQAPISRCVSPWCEHLGFKMDDPPHSFAKSNMWPRRGFNSSPTRMRSAAAAITPCHDASLCSHRFFHESGLYACVPVSLVPALCLETPCCIHSCHHASPIMTPSPIHTPHFPAHWGSPGIAETVSSSTPRRSFSANEILLAF